jgi:hypothetical protein
VPWSRNVSTVQRLVEGFRTRSAGVLFVELILLVVGVLLALGVDGWLERRREAAVAAQSLELVRNDLVQLMEQAAELEAHNRRVLEAVSLVSSAVNTPGLIERDPETFEALSIMMWRRTVRFPRAAYEELVATGNLRALADPDLRSTLVRFYQELERDEEIVLRNNETFTDRLFLELLVGQGLIINLPTGEIDFSLAAQAAADEVRREYLPVGASFKGRLWDLPAGHPDRVRLLSAITALSTPAAGHIGVARRAREGAAALIDRIDATLNSSEARDAGPAS